MTTVAVAGSTFTFDIGLYSQADTKLLQVNPTLTAADFKKSINGGALLALDNTPTVTPAGGTQVEVVLSAAETTAAAAGGRIAVYWQDAADAEWCSGWELVYVHTAEMTGDPYPSAVSAASNAALAVTLANTAATIAYKSSGLSFRGQVTGVPGANQFTVAGLIGLGAGLFSDVTTPWYAYVFRDAGGASGAPQGESRQVTAYDSVAGTFTTLAFSVPVGVGDDVLIQNPRLADTASILAIVNDATYGNAHLARPGDAMALTAGERTALNTSIWVTAAVRTLTSPAATVPVSAGTDIVLYRYANNSITITGLTISAARTALYLTVKSSVGDTDADALVQITEAAGLTILDGATATTPAWGSLTPSIGLDSVTVVLLDHATAELEAGSYTWDLKQILAAGAAVPLATGTCTVRPVVTQAVT